MTKNTSTLSGNAIRYLLSYVPCRVELLLLLPRLLCGAVRCGWVWVGGGGVHIDLLGPVVYGGSCQEAH